MAMNNSTSIGITTRSTKPRFAGDAKRSRRAGAGFVGTCCAASLLVLLSGCESVPSTDNASSAAANKATAEANIQRVAIRATAGTFEPAVVHLVHGVPAILAFTRAVESECMQAIKMPWMEEAIDLPMNQAVEIPVDTSMTGIFTYTCWMNMVSGEVMIE